MRFFLLLFLVACGMEPSKDEAYEPIPEKPCQLSGCVQVSYATQVSPIVSKSCLGASCHSTPGAGGIALDNISNLKSNYARAISSIQAGRMPKGRQISQTEIDTLKKWSPNFAP